MIVHQVAESPNHLFKLYDNSHGRHVDGASCKSLQEFEEYCIRKKRRGAFSKWKFARILGLLIHGSNKRFSRFSSEQSTKRVWSARHAWRMENLRKNITCFVIYWESKFVYKSRFTRNKHVQKCWNSEKSLKILVGVLFLVPHPNWTMS